MNYQKEPLRKKILKKRETLDVSGYFAKNNVIIDNVKSLLESINKKKNSVDSEILETDNVLGLYYPIKGEPDLRKIIKEAGFVFTLPKTDGEKLEFIDYSAGNRLEKSAFSNIMQPESGEKLYPRIIFIPGLAFSIKGYRLGFGMGHYDRYFAKTALDASMPITKIGVCFHESLYEYLPYDSHDIKLDYIITEKIIIAL